VLSAATGRSSGLPGTVEIICGDDGLTPAEHGTTLDDPDDIEGAHMATSTQSIAWQHDFDAAVAASRNSGRQLVLLDFSAAPM
jgi:hypothetical protein